MASMRKIHPAWLDNHKSDKSCWVTVGRTVYDVTNFLEDHPGGAELILEYGGQDVQKIMEDEMSHEHSDAAWSMMNEYMVGKLCDDESVAHDEELIPEAKKELGLGNEEEMEVPTDYEADYAKHKFIDLKKPMLAQVWKGGWSNEFYLDQVHRPRHYAGGASAPLFSWAWMEPLSLTPWWVVPIVWIPAVCTVWWLGLQGLGDVRIAAAMFVLGTAVWTLIEYGLHRFLFHLDEMMPEGRVFITLHFLLHGIHHFLPLDRMRLVMPPTLLALLATPIYHLVHLIFPYYFALCGFAGGLFGYICYDVTHYMLHHSKLPQYWRELKAYHLAHHFQDYQMGFGVTSKFWDRVFGTELGIKGKTA
ncbi:fatty acid alpha-hydroxylase [Saitoella coloradoensis]